jgi:inner membrane protein
MDSLTHIILGAAIGDKILGNKIGRKAAWIGALAKTFPDFDLLFSGLNDPRKYILYHRSYSHSFFIELITAFPMAWLCYILFKKKVAYWHWFLLWIVCLWGHSFVDIFTNYGTRVLLPFSSQLVAINNMAIADVFLTIPILIMLTIALIKPNNSTARSKWSSITLIYAGLYFIMTFSNKALADRHFEAQREKQHFKPTAVMSNPSILNNILWYSVFNTDSNLVIGEYSLLQSKDTVIWHQFPINKQLLQNCPSADARMLEWFSQGYYIAQQHYDTINVFIPKFGRSDLSKFETNNTFIFYYKLYQHNGVWKMDAEQPTGKNLDFKAAIQQLTDRVLGRVIY